MNNIEHLVLKNLKFLSIFQRLLILLTVLLLAWLYRYYKSKQDFYKKVKQFKSPKHLTYFPIVGHGLYSLGNPENTLKHIMKIFVSEPTPSLVWLGAEPIIFLKKAEDMELILNQAINKSDFYEFTKLTIGNGIFAAPAHIWKPNRKLLSAAFNQKILDSFVEVFTDKSTKMVNLLKNEVNNKKLNIHPFIDDASLASICETACGYKIDFHEKDNPNIEISKAIHRLMMLIFERMITIYYHPLILYKFTNSYKKLISAREKLHNYVMQIIMQKKLEKHNSQKFSFDDSNERRRKAYIDILLDMNDKFSDENIRDEVSTIIMAGSDTTSATVCFVLEMIAMHREVQEKVYNEVIEKIGPTKTIEYSDLPKLKYLEIVIKETMRLFPIAPSFSRKLDSDIKLTNGQIIPKDSTAAITVISLHRSSDYYPNPLVFIPERFLPEESVKRHPYAYLAFSGGPRNCIGPKYGMMAMKCLIADTIRHFKVYTHYKSVEEIRIAQNFVLTPVEGYKVYISNRD